MARFTKSIISAAAFALLGSSAIAATVNNQSTGLMNPTNTVDFSEVTVAPGTLVTTEFASEGVTFQPKMSLLEPGTNASYSGRPNFSGEALFNFGNDGSGFTIFNPFTINFAQNVSDATFAFSRNSGIATITAILDGTGLEQFTTAAGAQNGYFGFTGIVFDEILVTISNTNSAGAGIDNIAFNTVAPVPLPAGFGLLALALGGLGVAFRRRKAA